MTARSWYLAIPPPDSEHGPAAWQTRSLAEKSLWLNWESKPTRPVEVVHVREVSKPIFKTALEYLASDMAKADDIPKRGGKGKKAGPKMKGAI